MEHVDSQAEKPKPIDGHAVDEWDDWGECGDSVQEASLKGHHEMLRGAAVIQFEEPTTATTTTITDLIGDAGSSCVKLSRDLEGAAFQCRASRGHSGRE